MKQTILDRLVSESKQEGCKYDCIVPVSGGQDSSYVAYVLSRQFGLRILGVNFDNGYRSTLALENLERLSQNLEVDIVTLKVNLTLLGKLYAHFFRTCGYFCTVCNALGYIVIGSFAAREAKLRGVSPLLVGGWSRKYEYQPGLSVLSMKGFVRVLKKDETLFNVLRGDPLVDSNVFDAFMSVDDIRQMGWNSSEGKAARGTGMRFIQLPNYIDWDYREIDKILEREIGWKKSPDSRDTHFDCLLTPIQEYLKHRRFGFGQQVIKNSVMVREGRMSREEALRRSDIEHATEPPILQQVLSQWGMTENEIAWNADWAEY